MKKVAIIAVAVIIVLALVLLALPSFIDWNRYKDDITAQLEQTLGREVAIEGDLSLRLIPSPALSADQVRLANIPGASHPDMATVEALRLRLSALPLLRGDVEVESLVLVNPLVRLEQLADGRVNWDFSPPENGTDRAAGDVPPAEGQPRPDSQAAPARQDEGVRVTLERVMIENGRVIYRGPDGSETSAGNIDAILSMNSLSGPFSADGSLAWQNETVRFSGSLGRLGERAAPLQAELSLPHHNATAAFTGNLQTNLPAPLVQGKLAVTGNDLRATLAGLGLQADLPAPLAAAYSLNGAVHATDQEAALNDIVLSLGDTQGTGAVSVGLGERTETAVTLAFNRIDLDHWLAADPAAPAQQPAGNGTPAAPSPSAAQENGDFTLPRDLRLNLQLNAEALIWRGSAIRQARVEAALADGILDLRNASASLPGGTDVTTFGTLTPRDGQAVVDGRIEANSDNLRTLLQWLEVDVSQVPADRLRRFSLSGQVQGTLDEVTMRGVDIQLDTSRLSGAVTMRTTGDRPAFGINAVLDTVALDAYLPPPGEAQPEQQQQQQTQTQQQPQQQTEQPDPANPLAGLDALNAFDANIRFRANQVTYGGTTLEGVGLDATLLRGTLTLREAGIATLPGGSLSLSGVISGFGGGEFSLSDFAYDLRSLQPARLLRMFDITPPLPPEDLGSIAVTGKLDGNLENILVTSRNEIAGATLRMDGTVAAPFTAPRWDLAVEASHSNFTQLIRLFAPEYRPSGTLGSFALTTRAAGTPASMVLSDLRTKLGPANIAGNLTLSLLPRLSVSGELNAGDVDLDAFLPAERTAALAPYRDEGLLIRVQAGATPAQQTQAAQHWSTDPLDISFLRDIDAELLFNATALLYDRYRLEDMRLPLRIGQGEALIEQATAGLFGGTLTLNARAAARDKPVFEAGLVVADARVAHAALGTQQLEVTDGLLDADLRLGGAGGSMAELVASLSGQGNVNVRNGVVSGFDLGGVSQALGDIRNVGQAVTLVQKALSGGRTQFSELSGSYTATQGVIRSDNLHLVAEGGTATGTAVISLPEYAMDLRTNIRLAALSETPIGVQFVGPLDNPRRNIDLDALQALLAQRGIGALLERAPEGDATNILRGLLGQPSPSPQPEAETTPEAEQQPQQPQSPDEFRPEEILRGLLQDLGR
ncbi:AsmA family protein [Telmatospirillum sp. J64-1]|uniref:AsmA family protein n=1 Tax=Telmatospirillum sp. J64-1 TaxID=2502183 RepID=UPI00115DE450|nr:AsmA family protein [Telmatospirillum sp. J64-1]